MFDADAEGALFRAYWVGKRVRRQGSPMDDRDWNGTVSQIRKSQFSDRWMLIVDWDNSVGNSVLYSVSAITLLENPDV